MKAHTWIKYGSYGETIEITVRDFSGAKLESWKVTSSDKKALRKIYGMIKNKYGINMFIKFDDQDRDLSWLKK